MMSAIDRGNLQKLFRYAYALTADEQDAYDLLYAAIETSLNKPAGNEEKQLAYIRAIMRNRFIDEYRRQQSFPLENIDDHSAISINGSSLENVVIASHDLAALWKDIEPFDRELLYYWVVEGFSMAEISEKLDISRGTLLSRVHRLRKRFKDDEDIQQRGRA